jgi:pimeloyl-ACP methyl ester carboxylesterase
MPSPIRRDVTPPAPKLPPPPKPTEAQGQNTLQAANKAPNASTPPASQDPARLALRGGSAPGGTSGQASSSIQNQANTAPGRDGALAAIRGESTFKPELKPAGAVESGSKTAGTGVTAPGAVESAAKAIGAGAQVSAPGGVQSAGTAGANPAAPDVRNLGPEAPTAPGTTPSTAVSEPPSDPAQRADWWNGLSPEQQSQQIAADPAQIGSLDGLPASARDQANRQVLEQDITRLEAEAEQAQAEAVDQVDHTGYGPQVAEQPAENFLSDESRRQLENARAVQEQLDRVEGETDPVTGEPLQAQLLVYDPAFADGEGRAAIAVGNVDTADHVAVSVPGLGSDVRSYMDNLTGNALNLYNESRNAGGNVATVAWLGYDAPGYSNVSVDNAAENGAPLLAQDVAAIRASRGENQPHLTVIGHSYGSTTTSIAADRHGLDADDVVLIGSPGAGHADNVSDYEGIDGEHVWAGSNSRDPVTHLTGGAIGALWDPLGLDPSSESFGANRFQAEDVNRENGGTGGFDNHSRYYNENTESLYNLAAIVTGNYHQVGRAQHRDDSGDPEADRTPREVEHG